MLTRLTVRNFKRFKEVDIELDSPVVFVGPNNSGKTSAMQALALWDLGVRRWNEKYPRSETLNKGRGVALNRRDLLTTPVPSTRLLWHNGKTHYRSPGGITHDTERAYIETTVEGITLDKKWKCGFEFDYENSESFYSRPLQTRPSDAVEQVPIPTEARSVRIAYLPPMSGLAAVETRLDNGAVNVRIGEGRTAEVLRNLCLSICHKDMKLWKSLADHIKDLFECTLQEPQYIPQRGEISMSYFESKTRLDISSSGQGLRQTLLLLAYMYCNPNSVILLDEPDAHLEILRQRQTYRLISEVASDQANQIIMATHSEVLLNEAVGHDTVVAFLGTPHRIEHQRSHALESLRDIGFEDLIQAEQTRWVLYLRGPTDLSILQEFARILDHIEAQIALRKPFVHYFGNRQSRSSCHFQRLKEVVKELSGVALFDRVERNTIEGGSLEMITWGRREIENYFCSQSSLESFATSSEHSCGSTFSRRSKERRTKIMKESIREVESAMKTLGKGSPWDTEAKVSDDFLTPLFKLYFKKLRLPNLMKKNKFNKLVRHMPVDEISPEVTEKLDVIARVARQARLET